MSDPRFQIRLHLTKIFAEVAKEYGMEHEFLMPLADVLNSYGVTAETQLDKFAESIKDMTAQEMADAIGVLGLTVDIVHKDDELHRAKREKYSKIFVLDSGGDEFFTETDETKAMLSELRQLEGGAILREIQIVPVAPFHPKLERK